MEVSALTYSGGIGLHGRSRLLRLQSDERLVALLRKGNTAAFEVLVARYDARLHAFCRHLLGSREDAEDVMQEVMTAAFNAILADDRPINVRPWLYRIARNRSLNHLRRIQAIGVESMDVHFSDGGASTADKVNDREEFRLLVGDINELPETQKTALVLREMDALSYEQIAEAMETTVSSVKSLLVRARVSLAEAAEARMLSCDEVRIELAEVAEGLRRRPGALVRRHLRSCKRCTIFRAQLKQTNRALAALFPIGAMGLFHKLLFFHLGHSAGAGSSATAAGSSAAGAGAAGAGAAGAGAAGAGAAGTAVAGSGALVGGGGFVSAGIGAIATKAAAGLAAAALVTGAAVEADHSANQVRHTHHVVVASVPHPVVPVPQAPAAPVATSPEPRSSVVKHAAARPAPSQADLQRQTKNGGAQTPGKSANTTTTATTKPTPVATTPTKTAASTKTKPTDPGRTQNQSDATVLPPVTTPVGTPPPPPPPPATVASVPTTTPTGTVTTTPTTGTTTTTTPTTGTTTTTTGTGTTTTGTGTTTGGQGGGDGGTGGNGGTGTGGTDGTGTGGTGTGGTGTGGTGGTGTGGTGGTGTGSGGGQTGRGGSGGSGDTGGTGSSGGSGSAGTGSGSGSRLVTRHAER